eukprot:scaffold4550_cov128-Isochrysis_galbana.AAC.5
MPVPVPVRSAGARDSMRYKVLLVVPAYARIIEAVLRSAAPTQHRHESSRQRAWIASDGMAAVTLSSSSTCGGTESTPSR